MPTVENNMELALRTVGTSLDLCRYIMSYTNAGAKNRAGFPLGFIHSTERLSHTASVKLFQMF